MSGPSQRLGGRQVWSRQLIDNSRLIALVNAENTTTQLTDATCRIKDVFARMTAGGWSAMRQCGTKDVTLLRMQQ